MEKTRRLVIVRHAKAETFAPSDDQRPLTDRGRTDGRSLGEWLGTQGVVPDAAYVSAALRTRETWEVLAAGARWDLEPVYDGGLYDTDEEGALDIVRATPAGSATVVLVGHNPTVGMLVQLLDDGEGEASGAVAAGTFPTSTAAVFEVPDAWADLGPMTSRLTHFHVARD